jgi:hypothetical protein
MLKLRLCIIFLFAMVLTGCASVSPEELGMSEQQWDKYTAQEQKQMARNYSYIEKTTKQSSFSAQSNFCLIINIQNGKAIMPPFTEWSAFNPVTLKVSEGTCEVTELDAINGDNSTTLTACYNDNMLLLDPSLYEIDKRYGSIRMYYSLLWDDGFSYTNINTDGYTRLQKASIFVTKRNLSPEQCQ